MEVVVVEDRSSKEMEAKYGWCDGTVQRWVDKGAEAESEHCTLH